MDAPQQASAHGQLLHIAEQVNRAALAAHVPVRLILESFVEDEETKKMVMQILRMVESASGSSVMGHKTEQSMNRIRNSRDKRKSIQQAGQQLGREKALQSAPAVESILSNILMN